MTLGEICLLEKYILSNSTIVQDEFVLYIEIDENDNPQQSNKNQSIGCLNDKLIELNPL